MGSSSPNRGEKKMKPPPSFTLPGLIIRPPGGNRSLPLRKWPARSHVTHWQMLNFTALQDGLAMESIQRLAWWANIVQAVHPNPTFLGMFFWLQEVELKYFCVHSKPQTKRCEISIHYSTLLPTSQDCYPNYEYPAVEGHRHSHITWGLLAARCCGRSSKTS